MKRTVIGLAVCSLALLTAATITSTAWSGLKNGPISGPDEKRKDADKVLTGEIAVEVNAQVGALAHGEVEFPRELPKVPMIFLMENRQTGAFVVFKADEVTTKGFKWAGCKLWGGPPEYRTNLVWMAVLPD